ncbi:MAG: CPBP family intramembrane metalloprotease [Acidobacteriota bacterium]|nr:MAG: CPBP family intramembrane metalloprotease [Acidobacteriota bacterium]
MKGSRDRVFGTEGEFEAKPWPPDTGTWLRFILGLFISYGLFEITARTLASDRGQAGLFVGAVVVAAVFAASRWLLGEPYPEAFGSLGLGTPRIKGLIAAAMISALLLLVVPVYVYSKGASISMYPGWLFLLPGLFAQAGIAEEVLFRAYLFGRIRRGRTFRRAALIAGGPFVLVHLSMFATMPWPIALASVLLATALLFPLARLYELGGGTIWAPAILHWVIQGTVKVIDLGLDSSEFALFWILSGVIVPYVAFFVPTGKPRRTG